MQNVGWDEGEYPEDEKRAGRETRPVSKLIKRLELRIPRRWGLRPLSFLPAKPGYELDDWLGAEVEQIVTLQHPWADWVVNRRRSAP